MRSLFRLFMLNDIISLELQSANNTIERQPKDFQVEPERAMLQIEKIVAHAAHHFFNGVCVTVVECSIRCYSRTYLIEERISRIMFHDLVDVELALRTRSHKSHVPAENVPELW